MIEKKVEKTENEIEEKMNEVVAKQEEKTKKYGAEEDRVDNKDTEQEKEAEHEEDKEDKEDEKDKEDKEDTEKDKDDGNKKYKKKCWYLDTNGSCREKSNCRYSHEVCMYHKRTGYCKYMNDCKYVHSPITKELCRFQNNCNRGSECRYAHSKEDNRKTIPCKFEKERRCNKGERCEYKHVRGGRTNTQFTYPQRQQKYARYENIQPQRPNFYMWQQENHPRQNFQILQHSNGLRKQETDLLQDLLLRTLLRN